MRKNLLKKDEQGFTIIEVMIVLAIAALILVVVLVAIPQLQRNQRNQARQSMTARIVTEINNYAGNNNGQYPDANNTAWGDFVGRYLDDPNAYSDPLTDTNIAHQSNTTFNASRNLASFDPGEANYVVGSICDGEDIQPGEARNFSYQVGLEGGAVYCLDNR